MANNTYIGGEIKLIGGLSDLFAIDSKIVRYTKADNNGEISVQEIIDELLRRISVLEGSKNNVSEIILSLPEEFKEIVYGKNSTSQFKIPGEVKPDTALNKDITWKSNSIENGIIVDGIENLSVDTDSGLVTFKSAKTPNNEKDSITVRITATSVQNPDISAFCDIIVTKADNTITIKKGNTNITDQKIDVTLIDEIKLTGTDLSESTIKWESDRQNLLSIDEEGKVKFNPPYDTIGEKGIDVNVTAWVSNSDNYKGTSSQTTLNVKKATDKIHFKLNNVEEKTEISKTISTVETENSFKLYVTADSTNTIKSFESSDKNVATVTKDSDGGYIVTMLKWDANQIILTATTDVNERSSLYSACTGTFKLKINPIEQTLKATPNSLSWSGSEELDAKEITISGNQTGSTLSVKQNNNITSSIDGSKVSITPKSRNINTTVTINASKTDIYKAASVNVTVKADAQSIKYYWYVGQENPASMTNISPIVDDMTSTGWRYIGNTKPTSSTFTKTNMLWNGVNNGIFFSRSISYIAVPYKPLEMWDADGGDGLFYTIQNNGNPTNINGVDYYIYMSDYKTGGFEMNIYNK